MSSYSLELPVALNNPFIKLDDSASLFVKHLAQMNKDEWIHLIIGKLGYLILGSLEATTLVTTKTNSPQTAGKTKAEWLTLPRKVSLSYFSS